MPRYIDAEALKRKLIDEKSFFPAMVARALEEMPTADVVEVKHWEWLNKKFYPTPTHKYPYRLLVCSECCDVTTTPTKYCPNCGAKMDGERRDK